MTGLILRIILILIVLRVVYKFGRALLEGAGMLPGPQQPSQALTARSGGTTAYFCSEKCRREWEAR